MWYELLGLVLPGAAFVLLVTLPLGGGLWGPVLGLCGITPLACAG